MEMFPIMCKAMRRATESLYMSRKDDTPISQNNIPYSCRISMTCATHTLVAPLFLKYALTPCSGSKALLSFLLLRIFLVAVKSHISTPVFFLVPPVSQPTLVFRPRGSYIPAVLPLVQAEHVHRLGNAFRAVHFIV